LNRSDEEKYTFEKPDNIKNVNVDDNFDLDEFINEEDNRLHRRHTDLSTTNVSFFNINKDEILNLDFNNFLKGNLDETKTSLSNKHHSNSVNTAKHSNNEFKSSLTKVSEHSSRGHSDKNLLDDLDSKIIEEVKIKYYIIKTKRNYYKF